MTTWLKRSKTSPIETIESKKCASRRILAYRPIWPKESPPVQGDGHIAFLDHDDLLSPTLFRNTPPPSMSMRISICSIATKISYSRRNLRRPLFQTRLQPHLLREVNYVCHLLMVRNNLLAWPCARRSDIRRRSRSSRTILQAVEKGARIHHVPSVLYHYALARTRDSKRNR